MQSTPVGTFVLPDGRVIDLRGLYQGATAFLVCGGPSAGNLEALGRRGCLIFSYNNNPAQLPAHIRPQVWFHTDMPGKFSDAIWRDPSILKFVPTREWNCVGKKPQKSLRRKTADGFEPLGIGARQLPGVIGYERNTEFDPASWLTEVSINRGNCLRASRANGWPQVINSFFTALRLPLLLGVRRLFLIGCDFAMQADRPYGFQQSKSLGGVAANNDAFRKMDAMLRVLAPRIRAAGAEVYNCTRPSGLTAFEHVSFEEAVSEATRGFDPLIDPRGWYDD